MLGLRRREFILALGGAAAAWPIAARDALASEAGGQRGDSKAAATPVVGFLGSRSLEDSAALVAAFRTGLGETGFIESRNVTIEFRWAEGHYDRLTMLAADLAARKVAVLAAPGGIAAGLAAKAATATIPVIFLTGADPVQFGLVKSLNRPDGNVTGVAILTNTLAPKQLELLHEVVPTATLVAFLVNPKNPIAESDTRDLQLAAGATRQQILVLHASNDGELETAFAALVQRGAGALLVQGDPFFNSRPGQIVALAARHAIPAMLSMAGFSGGRRPDELWNGPRRCISAGRRLRRTASQGSQGRRSTGPAVREGSVGSQLRTAKALGLTFPLPLLGRADQVIE
jgi:ABC-type uncharacterized transport system substrate-binding protein